MANTVQIIAVTVRKGGPSAVDLSRPRVAYIKDDDIRTIHRGKSTKGGCAIIRKSDRMKLELYENSMDLRTAQEAASGGVYTNDNVNLAVSAAGSVIGTATALSKYLNKVTAATTTTANGVQLPAPSAGRNCLVVINSSTAPIVVYPHGASAFIDSGASGVAKTVQAGQRMHFATPKITSGGASAVWQSAIDDSNLS